MLMLTFTDINSTAGQWGNKLLSILWTCYVPRLKNGQYKVGSFFIAICNLLDKLNRIKNSRINEKQIKSNWI